MNADQAQIFLSYRRDDTAGYARALNDLLAQQFGPERVFIDVDDIGAGQAFDARIAQAMGQVRVLLVLIGPRWLAPQADGRPRLHHEDDMVRREVQAGLAAKLQVIPLLFDGAAMPTEAQLPGPLQLLARRQALVMDPRRFAADSQQLLAVLRQTLGAPPARPRTPWLLAGALAAVLAAAAAWWGLQPHGAPAAGTAAQAARPAVNGRWQADVRYPWMAGSLRETFTLQGEGTGLQGTASFLQVARGIDDGRVTGAEIRFTTRSSEVLGNGPEQVVTHQYSGSLDGDTLQLTLQTTGAAQPQGPLAITARRQPPP